jgi:hypothetical protein
MERKGKTLKVLPSDSPRRMSDARNAWRKMSEIQRVGFLEWIEAEHGVTDGAYLPGGWSIVDPRGCKTTGPKACGHSVCSQYYIDTGLRECVAGEHDGNDELNDWRCPVCRTRGEVGTYGVTCRRGHFHAD